MSILQNTSSGVQWEIGAWAQMQENDNRVQIFSSEFRLNSIFLFLFYFNVDCVYFSGKFCCCWRRCSKWPKSGIPPASIEIMSCFSQLLLLFLVLTSNRAKILRFSTAGWAKPIDLAQCAVGIQSTFYPIALALAHYLRGQSSANVLIYRYFYTK